MEVRKPDWRDQQIRIIESTTPGIYPTFKREYERRVRFPDGNPCQEVTIGLHDKPLSPFSEWKDSELEAYRCVFPASWSYYSQAIVLQRCNAFGKWSYRYVLNRVLIQ